MCPLAVRGRARPPPSTYSVTVWVCDTPPVFPYGANSSGTTMTGFFVRPRGVRAPACPSVWFLRLSFVAVPRQCYACI